MALRRIKVLCLLILILMAGSNIQSIAQEQIASVYLSEGLTAKQNGDAKRAADIWFEARTNLDKPSMDIAMNYLQLVTEEKMTDHYKMAYAMYIWALSSENVEENYAALSTELNFIKPIVGKESYDVLKELLDNADPMIYTELLNVWNDLNYLPNVTYNPRLIEHWERIAFARENFNNSSDPPYKTDERGFYHVKYGAPNRQSSIDLEIDPAEIVSIYRSSSEFSSENSALLLEGRLVESFANENIDGELHVWVYDLKTGDDQLSMKLFFREDPDGTIVRINTIDDLIPTRAFSRNFSASPEESGFRNSNLNSSISKGVLYQLYYYRKLRYMDPEFASIYASVLNDITRPTDDLINLTSGRLFKFQNQAKAEWTLKDAPESVSSNKATLLNIPIEIEQYRFMNEDDEPILITYVQNRPMRAINTDLVNNYGQDADDYIADVKYNPEDEEYMYIDQEEFMAYARYYRLRNEMQLHNGNDEMLAKSISFPTLYIAEDNENEVSLSVFDVPYKGDGVEQRFYAELLNFHVEKNLGSSSSNPQTLRGLGVLSIPQNEHLDISSGQPLISDIVLGTQKNDELHQANRFPFLVSLDRTLPIDEPMVVHFEVYMLQSGSNGISDFEVNYSFKKVRRFNIFRSEIEGISNTLSFQSKNQRFAESFEIETANLEEGLYDLEVEITDNISGNSTSRSVRFEVVNEVEFYSNDVED